MSKQRITTARKQASREDKQRRLNARFTEWTGDEITVEHAYLHFKIEQESKGNSKATIAFYERFYNVKGKESLVYEYIIGLSALFNQ